MRQLLFCLVVLPTLAHADGGPAAEFRASAGAWDYELTGTATDRNRTYDLQGDLGLETGGRRTVQVEWDTGPGWFPDLALSFTQLGASGHREYEFPVFDLLGNPVGTTTETIAASADFDDYDLALRYPFRLGAVDLSAGVLVKRLRGEVLIDDSQNPPPSRQQYDETVPELQLQLRVPVASWLVLAGAVQGVSYDGNSAREWRATAELRPWGVLLIEAGWQQKAYEIQLTDYALDAQLGGAIARAGLVFR
jgi:hypothetical protein